MTRRKGWPRSDVYSPTAKKIAASRKALRFDVLPLNDERVSTLLATCNASEYCEIVFARLRMQGDAVVQELVSTNRSPEYGLGELILTSDALRTALPQLQAPLSLDPKFHWAPFGYTGFGISGDLAERMWDCPPIRLSDSECMRVANDFLLAITGGRYSDFHVLKTFFPWSPFFDDEEHEGNPALGDTTWLVVDGRNGDVSCLFASGL